MAARPATLITASGVQPTTAVAGRRGEGSMNSVGGALANLGSSYPVAMRYLQRAYDAGRARGEVRSRGGRFKPLGGNVGRQAGLAPQP